MPSTAAGDPGIDYLERARAFVPELAAAAPEIERQRELPEPVVAAMVERGFFRMLLPRSLGGAELLPAPYVRVVEEIAKGDASAAWCLNQGAGCSMTAAYLDPTAAKQVFGGPRGILAWGPGPGKARVVEGGYRVTATWSSRAAATTRPGSVAMCPSTTRTARSCCTPTAARSSAPRFSRNPAPR
jgi:indole-3-acetate monooxygenase